MKRFEICTFSQFFDECLSLRSHKSHMLKLKNHECQIYATLDAFQYHTSLICSLFLTSIDVFKIAIDLPMDGNFDVSSKFVENIKLVNPGIFNQIE